MKFRYYRLVTDAGADFINVKLNGNENFILILWDALKSINPADEMLTPLNKRFKDEWELGVQSNIGYFKVKVELLHDDVWISGTADCITAIDLLLQNDERFERAESKNKRT